MKTVLIGSIYIVLTASFLSTAVSKESELRLTLDQAIALALIQNRTIINSRDSFTSRELSLESALSDFDIKVTPSAGGGVRDGGHDVSLGVGVSKRLKNGYQLRFTPDIGINKDRYSSGLGLGLDIPLLRGAGEFAATSAVASARYGMTAAGDSLEQTRIQIVLNTVNAYYQVFFHRKKAALTRRLVSRLEAHSAMAGIKTDVGIADPLDVYRAEIETGNAKTRLATAMEALSNAKSELKTVLGVSQDNPIEIAEDNMDIRFVNMDIEQAETVAMEKNLDMKFSRESLKEVQRKSRLADHNQLPDLKFSLEYFMGGGGGNVGQLFEKDRHTWGAFLTTSTDFSRTAEKIAFHQSLIDVKRARSDFENTKDQVKKEIRSRFSSLEKIEEQMDILQKQREAARGKLALAQIKFNNKMAGNFDLIEAENQVHQAQLDLLSGKINYIINQYGLRAILGVIFPEPERPRRGRCDRS